MASPHVAVVVIRDVWASNLEEELSLLRQSLRQFPFASFDTEFPGTIFTTDIPFSNLPPSQLYFLMKKNVDSLKLVQLGITLSDAHGSLPSFGSKFQYVWQFNFCDFNPDTDLHDPKAIPFLKDHGMDFVKNRDMGIDSATFASKFVEYGLGWGSGLKWVTFDGLYDYGYLLKILTGKELPYHYEEFMRLKQIYFGFVDYDTKGMAQQLGHYGGLEKICSKLKLERVAGNSHQAGSDSLLTMHLFLLLRKNFFETPLLSVNKFNQMTYYRRHPFISYPSRPINHVLI